MDNYLTRHDLSLRLDVSRSAVYRHATLPGFPKPDDIWLWRDHLSPVWRAARVPELQDYFARVLRVVDTGPHNTSCKCMPCRVKASDRTTTYQAKRRAGRIPGLNGRWWHPDAPHGRVTGYVGWGCLCDDCTEAYRRYYKKGIYKDV